MLDRLPLLDVPSLPWLLITSDDDAATPRHGRKREQEPADSQAPTILVVDDDLANLALAQALLEAEGFAVQVAIDARSMFAALAATRPALILMDIQLPEVDGWELTRRLKEDAATRDIPVIAITAYGKSGDVAKARQVGFAEFLAKPVSTRELPGIIRRHLPTP